MQVTVLRRVYQPYAENARSTKSIALRSQRLNVVSEC